MTAAPSAPPPWPKAVIFDLDGTLVDSAADIAGALNTALGTVGLAPFSVRDVQDFIGGGSMVLIQKALAVRNHAPDDATWARLVDTFMTAYHALSAEGRGLYPGAKNLLVELKAAGHRLALCTNKPHPVTETALTALGLSASFDIIQGATDAMPRKPAPDMLLSILERLNLTPADAVMIGDSAADLGAARSAGMPVVLVTFGYAKTPVADMGADALIAHLSELPAALSLLPRKA